MTQFVDISSFVFVGVGRAPLQIQSTTVILKQSYKSPKVQYRVYTNFKSLDDVLCGFRCGKIYEVYGEAGTGKTQFRFVHTVFNPD